MKSILVKVIDPIGIHARPASEIANASSKFESSVSFKNLDNDKIANAKSIINLMSLGAKKDSQIEVIVNGADEEKAIEELKQLMIDKKLIEIL